MAFSEIKHRYFKGKLALYINYAKKGDTWYARIKLKHKGPTGQRYVMRSLETTDENEAIEAAKALYYKLEDRQDQGIRLFRKNIAQIIDEFMKDLEKKVIAFS